VVLVLFLAGRPAHALGHWRFGRVHDVCFTEDADLAMTVGTAPDLTASSRRADRRP
jgi:hypothetical protein